MINSLKISVYVGLIAVAIVLTSSLSTIAQVRGIATKDSLRMDSAMKVMRQQYLVKVDSAFNDTSNRIFRESPFQSIFISSGVIGGASQAVMIQAIRAAHSYYLNVLVKGTSINPVTVSVNDLLHLTFDDNSTATLTNIGTTASHSNGMRNGSDLQAEYNVPADALIALTAKKVTSIRMDYDGGFYTYNLNNEGMAKLMKVCSLIR